MTTLTTLEDHPLLSGPERAALMTRERLEIGAYQSYPSTTQCQFVIDLDARPLAVLAEAAALGTRVYEFMTIRRPGDIFNYLYVTDVAAPGDLAKHVASRRKRDVWGTSVPPSARIEMPFAEFDELFHWSGDDTLPFEATWCNHRDGRWWSDKASALLDLVRTLQGRLRQESDFLLQHEIKLIDNAQHRRDLLANIERRAILEVVANDNSKLPPALFGRFMTLIKRDDVQSVSCEFKDYALWRALVAEQVRRAQASGLPPQDAFQLSGPDSGLRHVAAEDWGGYIHIPYEGIMGADLFVNPHWRRFLPEAARTEGCLAAATGGKGSHYVLIEQDYGELDCAERNVLGDWVLYKSKAPYQPWTIKSMVY